MEFDPFDELVEALDRAVPALDAPDERADLPSLQSTQSDLVALQQFMVALLSRDPDRTRRAETLRRVEADPRVQRALANMHPRPPLTAPTAPTAPENNLPIPRPY